MANEPNEEEQPLLHAATYTQAPKVSHKVLTKEERQTLIKEHEAQQQEAAKLDEAASKGRIGRWWSRLQSGPDKITPAMAIVALGVVYGDIGTSPLYTMQTFLNGQGGLAHTDRAAVLGILSLVFWSITLITTVKYVFIAMRIDNNGEGGIFALYSLIRKYGAWLAIPAMLGGAAFLADSVLTPAVSISSAVEGLETLPLLEPIMSENKELTLMITIVIIVCLFAVQSRGTERIGRTFGTVVMIWFSFLAVVGLVNLSSDWSVLEALNPVYGVEFLFSHHNAAGLAVMGTVFLSTTGAEALYSDMGHVGRGNIYATWPFVKCCLLLSYMGQGAWLINNAANPELMGIADLNPFYQMLAPGLRPFAVGLSTVAAIIASQALITGAFSLVSEASRLDLMPHMQVFYPAETKGQLYIPMVNNVMLVGCVIVVLLFQNSAHMEAAYGLAITLTMMCTTLLLFFYLHEERKLKVAPWIFAAFFLLLEGFFFVSSLTKFFHGGYFTILMAALIMGIMVCWYNGTAVEQRQFTLLPLRSYLPQLKRLRDDDRYERLSDNIVYLTKDTHTDYIDRDIVYSILDKHPKRARAWWFVNVETMDEPHTFAYSVETFGTDYVFRVHLYLGYKINQRVNAYLRQVVQDLAATGELPAQTHDYSVYKDPGNIGTFKFVLIRKLLAPESDVEPSERTAITLKYIIRRAAGTPARWYGLENSNVSFEYVPLFTKFKAVNKMQRLAPNERP